MERMIAAEAPSQCARELRETTRRLSFWLDSLPDFRPETQQDAATPEQMTELLSELLKAGEWLRANNGKTDPDLESERASYRKQVERLRGLLPSIHQALLRERSRLEQERERLTAAGEWARVSRQTL
jgi:hypothetical protein